MREANAINHGLQPGSSIFYNGRTGIDTPEDSFDLQTHLELEDLPTIWGGYDKFAPRIKFFDAHPVTRDMAKLAMSGKFHTMWGEFGGYEHPDAFRFEVASMIAYNATCSFGD